MKRILMIAVAFLVSASALYAQSALLPAKPEEAGFSTDRLTRIDQTINEHLNAGHIPGAVVFIARNGKIVMHKAYGYSDVESKTALKKDDIFRMASQSKAITSLAIMMLWEENKFGLDDPVSRYIPEFRNPKVMTRFNIGDSTYAAVPAKSEVTIRQLLTHTSGIDYAGIGSQEFKAIYAKAGVTSGIGGSVGPTIGEKMKVLGGLPLKNQPGEQFTYGLNSDVLGYLVEVLSGKSFDEFLRTRIFQPLGMKDTHFYLPKDKHGRLVALHMQTDNGMAKVKGEIYDRFNVDYPKMAGTYYSGGAGLSGTIEDYAKFLQLFINGGTFNGTRLLSRKTVELMLTNQIPSLDASPFGLGFGLETAKNDHLDPASVGSFTWGGAFNTSYWGDPKEKMVALIYTNIYGARFGNMGIRTLVYQAMID
ncbi:MAG: serine hydrolase domain-containing protein [Bacteroidota bacterium]